MSLWRVAKVDEKYFFTHRLNMGEFNMGENTARFKRMPAGTVILNVNLHDRASVYVYKMADSTG